MSRADYAPSSHPSDTGGLIAAIDPGSPAQTAGIRPGESVLEVDGASLHDVLDWQWDSDGLTHVLTVRSVDGTLRETVVQRPDFSRGWGVTFAELLFDGVRTCHNRCAFCFMTQLPKGLRRPLYVRDDDFRLSFLQGNFVTLTNLDSADLARIIEQRLSPLYVSLHAVDPEVRARLVCAREDRALERIDALLEGGTDLHVQIVLVPGVNDGDELEKTLRWLAEREGIASVGVVPLGYTRHQNTFNASYNEPAAAKKVIRQITPWQTAMRQRDGVSWVYLADEFYLSAGEPVPPADNYDGYPQYENGIGIVRSFADDVDELHERLVAAANTLDGCAGPITLVSGTLAAPVLSAALSRFDHSGRLRTLPVPNSFFGGNVSVVGLLVGSDLSDAVVRDGATGIYLVPDIVFNADGVTLDDLDLSDMRQRTGADLRLVSSDAAGLLAGLQMVGAELAHTEKE